MVNGYLVGLFLDMHCALVTAARAKARVMISKAFWKRTGTISYCKMMTWILIKRLVESVHMTRHLFCLTRNFDNDRSLSNANDRSLVKSCYKTSFYKINENIIL